MKVIFLDVDGVLNCSKTWESEHVDGTNTIDPAMCDQLARIVNACWPVTVVLSSTWRLYPGEGLDKLRLWLEMRNVRWVSATPCLAAEFSCTTQLRGLEIERWFEERPQIDRASAKILILDDSTDFTEEQKPFHIQTSFETGLTQDLADAAIAVLEAQ
jgi:hypothetical protein